MSKYNGHESYNAWNVSRWIGNDEGLYLLAKSLKRRYSGNGGSEKAAEAMMEHFKECGVRETPDGVPYSKHTVKLALRGL